MPDRTDQTNDPYIHHIGDYTVKVSFQKEGPDIDDKMKEYLRRLTKGQEWYSGQ